jgi:hypothetical protein
MPRPPSRSRALLVVAVLAAGLVLGVATMGAADPWSSHGRVATMSFTAAPVAPLEAIVPVDASRVLVGRLGNPLEDPRAALLAALLSALLLLPALRLAFGPARAGARSPWLSPGRRSVAVRAPPRSRLV